MATIEDTDKTTTTMFQKLDPKLVFKPYEKIISFSDVFNSNQPPKLIITRKGINFDRIKYDILLIESNTTNLNKLIESLKLFIKENKLTLKSIDDNLNAGSDNGINWISCSFIYEAKL